MQIKQGFILKEIAGKKVVVAVGDAVKVFNGVINLNDTGAFLFEKLIVGATEEELVKSMLTEYETDEKTAREGVKSFINKLSAANMLK